MRKRLWQIHAWLGLTAGLGLLVIGTTGSLLVFHDELEALFNPESIRVEPTPTGRLPFDTLRNRAQHQLSEYEITGWLTRYDATSTADLLYVIRRGDAEWQVATLDPYTGQILASPRRSTATLTGWLLELHYAFFADHTGLFIAGLFAVMLCFLGLTGVWLYRDFWKHFFRLRWGRSARILTSDLHKFVGITSVAFNLVLGFTGAYWNFTHVIGEWINGEPPQPKMERRLYSSTVSLDALVVESGRRIPGFRANYLSLPSSPSATAIIAYGAVEPRPALCGPYGSNITFNAQTGAFESASDIRTASPWARIADTFTPLHFGTFGGMPVKILWAVGGLSPGVLAVSGFSIWWHRRRKTLRTFSPDSTERLQKSLRT